LNKHHDAIDNKLKAYKLFDEINALKEQIDCALNLGSTYKDVNDLPNAIKYYREAFYLKDTLFNTEMTANIAQMRTKFETEKKEQENIRLQKENEIQALKITLEKNRKRNIIIAFGFAVLAFVFLFMRYKLIKKAEIERKLSEEKHLRLIEVIAAEEKERTRVARELHDGLGQILSTARINLAGLEETIKPDDKFLLDNSLKLIDQSVAEVRSFSHNLMPVSLMRYGLKAAIEEIARRINDSGKIRVEHNLQNLESRLPESVEHAVYRLIQEIVNNILKHSGASFIIIDAMLLSNNQMTLRFENDGKTLDTSMLSETTGMGWKNIYTRVNMLNGEIAIQPRAESGTIIQIQFIVS
jgi:signal transduction histidine kinase